ncbi:MAG: adenosylmethionine--8-amino-7-oxononanoate transaminase [Gammaproteobacteria bacterium]|nr:adenosylmethionine--8-amino-7-oxononanoate transaminase [Gammaproteobacteria bacterium]
MGNNTLIERDLSVLWHPCTQMKDHESLPIIPIKSGDGIWLEDFDGNRYIDAISSWWVNLFGHCNPRINQALQQQMQTLEHVILAGFTHETIVELSERLVKLTPAGLNKTFFADNGSSAIEVALKMSFHYWVNTGKKEKTTFINLSNSYHGETIAALSVGDVALYKSTYEPLLLKTITAPSPDCFNKEEGETDEDYSARMIEPMREILQQHADHCCAVIIEPLIQCAGNMRMYHPVYLKLLRQACDEFDVHLICDEVAVGFGRTGTLFASEQAEITPDFMCLSKGLTGGYLPLSCVLTTDKIYDAFYDDYVNLTAFLHSHSYTGNPMGCRAALATLDIFAEDDIIQANQNLIRHLSKVSEKFKEHPHVSDVRQHGMVVAIEMAKDKKTKTPYDWKERRGLRVYQYGLKNGVLIRPLGNVVYFMPPYVITEDEIDKMAQVAFDGINLATKD